MVKKRVLYSDDSDDDQPLCPKKPKSDAKKLHLADLKADLLMRIFDELPLDDLSNVAMVNTQFNHMVYTYLGEICTTKRLTIHNTPTASWLWLPNTVGKFKFDGPAQIVAFFHTSGHLITHLFIDCESNYPKASYKCMEQVIFKYCSNALTHIEIRSTNLPVFGECSEHRLPKMSVLTLNTCELGGKFGEQLNALFPSLKRLVLVECTANDPAACLDIQIPGMIEFRFIGLCKNRMVLKKANLLRTIQMNPQLRRFSIDFRPVNQHVTDVNDFELDCAFYRAACEHLPKLECLKMWSKRHYNPPTCWNDKSITLPSVKTFELVNIYHQKPNEIAPFTFQHLQELKLVHLKALTAQWMNFITGNVQLTKLTVQLYGSWWSRDADGYAIERREQITKNQLLTIFKRLTQLEELCCEAKTVDANDLVAVLYKRKSLMSICLRDYDLVDGIVDTFGQLIEKKPWILDYGLQHLYLRRYTFRPIANVPTYEYFAKK